MSFAEYARLRHATPYVLWLARDRDDGGGARAARRLVVFGTRHTSDPTDPMFAELEAAFAELGPAFALHEGTPPHVEADRELAIRKHCEAGLVRLLAARAGIATASMDIALEDEARLLCGRFGAGDALVFLTVRQLASFNRKSATMDFDGYFRGFFARIGPALGHGGPGPTLDWPAVEREHLRVFGSRLDARSVTSALTDPVRDELLTQRIAADSNRLRDEHMLGRVLDSTARHGRVLAAVGASHAVMLEPAFAAAGWKRIPRPPR